MRIARIAAVLLACVALAGELRGANGIERFLFRPAGETYVESGTGLEFPSEIADFKKNRVTENREAGIGTTVRYVGKTGVCADVYIFAPQNDVSKAITDQEFNSVFSSTKATILALAKRSETVRAVTELAAEGLKTDTAVPHSKALFRIDSKTESLDSLLVLAVRGTRIIKIRISWSAGNLQEQENAVTFANRILQEVGNARAKDNAAAKGAAGKGEEGHAE